MMRRLIVGLAGLLIGAPLMAEEIGSGDTVFKWLGPNHKIVVG